MKKLHDPKYWLCLSLPKRPTEAHKIGRGKYSRNSVNEDFKICDNSYFPGGLNSGFSDSHGITSKY